MESSAHAEPIPPRRERSRNARRLWAVLPLVLLAIALTVFTAFDTKVFGLIGDSPPAADEFNFQNVQFKDEGIVVHVTNPQPQALTIASVAVDGAITLFSVDGSPELGRLDRRAVTIPFPWNEGEPYSIAVTSSTGIESVTEVAAAVPYRGAEPGGIFGFALIGLLVGFLPVALGLMWLPSLQTLSEQVLSGFMALTAGLLSFLVIDALFEAFEQQALLPGALGGTGLILLGVTLAFVGVAGISEWLKRRGRTAAGARGGVDIGVAGGSTLALAIAIGIGLHNLGEGLAIGTSFAVGELALGSLLIIGFTVHNITEGLGIAVPLADDRSENPRFMKLAMLAAIAGLPAVLGAWIGGFFSSSLLGTLFFAIAAGAAAQVVWEVSSYIRARAEGGWRSPTVAIGFVAGVAIMYATSLIAG
ncbi:MAG: ZIP family metal transporter [Solirubrobacterales bacterium]